MHPFEISFTRTDVRITGRFRENWLPGGLFAVWHEAGHGIYEQGVSPDFTRSVFTTDFVNLYAVGGASFGMHELQSRLWENRVGRSRRFWEQNFGALSAEFPDQLADVSVAEFWRAVNAPRPSLIRVEADELTYDLHIILRSEIEAGLMDGSLARRRPSGGLGRQGAHLSRPRRADRHAGRPAGRALVGRHDRIVPDLHDGQRHVVAAVQGGDQRARRSNAASMPATMRR